MFLHIPFNMKGNGNIVFSVHLFRKWALCSNLISRIRFENWISRIWYYIKKNPKCCMNHSSLDLKISWTFFIWRDVLARIFLTKFVWFFALNYSEFLYFETIKEYFMKIFIQFFVAVIQMEAFNQILRDKTFADKFSSAHFQCCEALVFYCQIRIKNFNLHNFKNLKLVFFNLPKFKLWKFW